MKLEIRHRHLAGEDEGHRAREEAEEEQTPAEYLEDAADPDLGHELCGAAVRGHPDREGEQLGSADQQEHERGNDAEHAQELRSPGRPLGDDVRSGHDFPPQVGSSGGMVESLGSHSMHEGSSWTPEEEKPPRSEHPPPNSRSTTRSAPS